MSQSYIFYVRGMTCGNCSTTIESYLRGSDAKELGLREPGLEKADSAWLKEFHVDLGTPDPKKTTITLANGGDGDHEEIWEKIRTLIKEVGFDCEEDDYQPIEESKAPLSLFENIIEHSKRILTSHWFLGALGCLTGVGLLITFLATGGLSLAAMIAIGAISTLLTLALGANSYNQAWKKLTLPENTTTVSDSLTMDSLFALSTLTVIAVSIASFFVPWLPMMFEVGLLIFGFRHIGIAIEETLKKKINSAKFQDRAPKKVRLLTKQGIVETKLYKIQPGDVIVVEPGDIIPLDGLCEEDSSLYNTIITGAILPRPYLKNEKVLAGMRLAEDASPLKIQVTRTMKESYLNRLDQQIAQSVLEKTPLEITTKQILAYFIPTVIAIAIISGIIISIFFPPALAIQCALSVLVSACPCTLGLIIPLAAKTGIQKAAEHGVQFKNSDILQQAEQIDIVVMDLNGTLTTGTPVVKDYVILDNTELSSTEFFNIAYALEKTSTHPIGKSIATFAQKKNNAEVIVNELQKFPHSGVSGEIQSQHYTLGNMTLMNKQKIATSGIDKELALLEAGDSVIFLAKNNVLIGYIVITDPLREDACPTINTLRGMGIQVDLLTGADEKTAERYNKTLKLPHIQAGCVSGLTETSKAAYIRSLQKKGFKVAMVGDAANDADAIATSDFGIAVLSNDSDPLTQDHAGAIIQSGTLLPIASAFAISKQTVSNIQQNLIMSFGYNLIIELLAGGLLIGIGFILNPAVGAALMAIQAGIILLNLYRFKHQTLDHLEKAALVNPEQPLPSSSRQLTAVHSNSYSYIEAMERADTPRDAVHSKHSTLSKSYSFFNSCCSEDSKTIEEIELLEMGNPSRPL